MIKDNLLLVVLFFYLTTISCRNIEGNYVYNESVSDTLKVFTDGVYERTYNNGKDVIKGRGKWVRQKNDAFFYDWINIEQKDKVIRGMKIENQLFSSEIRLYIDYDNNLYYERMN